MTRRSDSAWRSLPSFLSRSLHVLVVRRLGGGPGPEHQLAYPPILLAAYIFGLRGALLSALVAALVSGPFPILLDADPAHWAPDGVRLTLRVVMFFVVAAIVGVLFDHLRGALEAVRASAAHVSLREREGMLALARGAEAKDTMPPRARWAAMARWTCVCDRTGFSSTARVPAGSRPRSRASPRPWARGTPG